MAYRVLLRDIVEPLGKIIGFLILFLLGFELLSLPAGQIIGFFCGSVIGAYLIYDNVGWLWTTEREKIDRFDIVRYTVPLALSSAVYILVGHIDLFIIGYYLNAAQVGQYQVGYFLAGNILIVLHSVTPIFKPVVSGQTSIKRLNETYRRATRWVTMLTLPIASVFVLAPGSYLKVLFTESYANAGTATAILTIGYMFNVIIGPEGMMIEGMGKTRLTFLNTLILLTFNTILDILLVPHYGIMGAAIATSSALMISGIAGLLEIRIFFDIRPQIVGMMHVYLALIPSLVISMLFLVVPDATDLQTVFALPIIIIVPYILILHYAGILVKDDYDAVNHIAANVKNWI